MSTRFLSLCWPLAMSPTRKLVLISLADQANDDGVCWPSVMAICARTCLSKRSVQQALGWLERTGAVERESRAGRSTLYRLKPKYFADEACVLPAEEGTACAGAAGAEGKRDESGASFPGSGCTQNLQDSARESKRGCAQPSRDGGITREEGRLLWEAGGAALDPCSPILQVVSHPARWRAELKLDLHTEILPMLRAVSARASPGKVRSWAYFDRAMADLAERKSRPLPRGPLNDTTEAAGGGMRSARNGNGRYFPGEKRQHNRPKPRSQEERLHASLACLFAVGCGEP